MTAAWAAIIGAMIGGAIALLSEYLRQKAGKSQIQQQERLAYEKNRREKVTSAYVLLLEASILLCEEPEDLDAISLVQRELALRKQFLEQQALLDLYANQAVREQVSSLNDTLENMSGSDPDWDGLERDREELLRLIRLDLGIDS